MDDMTYEIDEAEEAKLIAEFIEHDKSLTDSERSEKRTQERQRLYAEQLQRQLEHMSRHMPSFLMAMSARNNYRVACSLWPEDMAHVLRDEFLKDVMRRSERCLACWKDLPLPYSNREYCSKCEAEFENIANDTESA